MRNALILAGAALAIAAAPAAAKPDKGHGKHGSHQSYAGGHGYNGNCPPGLAKKNNGCLPPGQAKKLARGQRYYSSYNYDRYRYNQIPYEVRRQYGLDPRDNYYYDNGTIYGVDPRTSVIQQVIRAILR